MSSELHPSPRRFLRDILIVAGQELADSIRSRRALVVLLLFLGGAAAGSLLSIKFIESIEKGLNAAMGLDASGRTGDVTATVWKNPAFRHTVTEMIGDRDLAESLLNVPPLSLFYCAIAFFFTPMLVALTSSARMTEEIWSGSARFVLFRTTRLAWCLGKYGGQALQLLVAFLLSVPVAWLCGYFRLASFDGAATLLAMLIFTFKAWIYSLSFLGIVSGLSLWCRNPGIATALGLFSLIVFSAVYYTAKHFAGEGWRRSLDLVQLLTPRAHYFDLLRPDLAHAVTATVFIVALSLGYLLLGHLRLSRRDL